MRIAVVWVAVLLLTPVSACQVAGAANVARAPQRSEHYEFKDAHFHPTNYIQEGPGLNKIIEYMGERVGRTSLSGLPLQQKWSYAESGKFAPDYYLSADSELYYYAAIDALKAAEYLTLPEKDQARLDPMITGFNPTDMYAADHIRICFLHFPVSSAA